MLEKAMEHLLNLPMTKVIKVDELGIIKTVNTQTPMSGVFYLDL